MAEKAASPLPSPAPQRNNLSKPESEESGWRSSNQGPSNCSSSNNSHHHHLAKSKSGKGETCRR